MLIARCGPCWSLLLQHTPADDLVLDLTGALEDRQYARVAPEALRLELHRVSVTAMHLHRLARDPFGHLGGKRLGQSGFVVASLAGVFFAGGEVAKLARGFDLDGHVRQLVPDHLEVADRLAELLAVLRILDRAFERRLRHADAARRRLDSRRLVTRHQLV